MHQQQVVMSMKFPHQLHALLSEAERLGLSDIIAWEHSGESFIIRKPHAFAEKIMSRLFRQTKFSSFKRQLNAYGFERHLSDSMDVLVYSNLPLFRRASPKACDQICRRRSGQAASMKANVMEACKQLQAEGKNDEVSTSRSVTLLHDSTDATASPALAGDVQRDPIQSDPVLDEMTEFLDCSEEDCIIDIWDPHLEGLL